MSDIFISYKREDLARIANLVQALQADGLDVWWDQSLPGGESWRANIHAALEAAKCVIVAWTKASAGPAGDFVRDEAGHAKERGILVPILLEAGARPPLGFGEVQAIDLSHWRGSRSDPFYKDLVAACRAKIDGKPAPRSQGPAKRLYRRLATAATLTTLSGAAVAFGLNFLRVQDQVCRIPVAQPAIADVCGALHLGNQPTREARLAFEALPAGDCDALSAFRTKYESSPLRTAVDSRLNDRHPAPEPVWTARPVSLPLTQIAPDRLFDNQSTAQQAALEEAGVMADRLCRTLTTSGQFRLNSVSIKADKWQCDTGSGGVSCGFDGTAECQTEAKTVAYVCGISDKAK